MQKPWHHATCMCSQRCSHGTTCKCIQRCSHGTRCKVRRRRFARCAHARAPPTTWSQSTVCVHGERSGRNLKQQGTTELWPSYFVRVSKFFFRDSHAHCVIPVHRRCSWREKRTKGEARQRRTPDKRFRLYFKAVFRATRAADHEIPVHRLCQKRC